MKIEFISNKPWLNKNTETVPISSNKTIPSWYLSQDRYIKNNNNQYALDESGAKIPNWKACPAIYDILSSGYMLRTPCDITFYVKNNNLEIKIHKRYADFIQKRSEMHGFPAPEGYLKDHFAWWPDWGIRVPDGYSVLYSQPFNRFDLPFLNTTGIVDQDKVHVPGTIPFFIRKDWEGTIYKNTPYLQLFPFKRDDWESELLELSENDIYYKNIENSYSYRKPGGGVYLNQTWERRKYV